MAQPTLVLWVDSLNEKKHQEERVRLNALNTGIARRAHRLIASKLLVQTTVRPESDKRILEALPSREWLSAEQIVIWQLSKLIPTDYRFRVCVVCLDPDIEAETLEAIRRVVYQRYAELQIPFDFVLIWYKAGNVWVPGDCSQFFPRFAVSNRVTDWQNVVEHLVVANADVELSASLTSASTAAVEVVWCGAAAVNLGIVQAQETVRENMYRHMIEIMRADDLTQEEVDASKRVAKQNRAAYARDMMAVVNAQVTDNFDFSLEYAFDEHAEAPVVIGGTKKGPAGTPASGFAIRAGSAFGAALFPSRADWWLAMDRDASVGLMFKDLLAKDTFLDTLPKRADVARIVHETLSRLYDRTSVVVAESSQKSIDAFFSHIYEQIETQNNYGLRNIQQSLHDFILQLQAGKLLSYNASPVPSSVVMTSSYFAQTAERIYAAVVGGMTRITRRRREVYSVAGSVLRMILVIPLINGIVSVIGPAQYQDLAVFAIPLLAISAGLISAIESYRQYHLYARQVRQQVIQDVIGGAVLEVIESVYTRERNRVLAHLQHLDTIYIDLIESYEKLHAEQVKPSDSISSNQWTLQQIDSVWGQMKRMVAADPHNLGDWNLVIGEEVTTYEIDGQTRLSMQSETQVEVNRDARGKGLYRGSVLLLQQVADQLRRRPLTKQSVERRMREFCAGYVARVFSNPLNKLHLLYEINRSADVVMPSTGTRLNRTTMLGDGRHWIWLHTAANQNATPRPDTPAKTQQHSVLLVPPFLQGDLEGRYGKPSEHWVAPTAVLPLSRAFDEEIISVRMDIDYVK